MGADLGRVLVVGCEPVPLDPDTEFMGLSEPVERAAGEAVGLVESLVASIVNGEELAQRRRGAEAR
jgi:hypothetical protein